MKVANFYSVLLNSLKGREDILVKKYKLKYHAGKYDFLRISSRKIASRDKVILIRAGIHGNEIAGPLTILSFCNEIIDYIHQAGLKFIIYPLGNPSGFEMGKRYNIDEEVADGNNDFLRYELGGGGKWHWSSDPKLRIKLPKETKLMHKLLKKDPLSQIEAFLDLHQDLKTKNVKSAAYHYSFGGLSVYENIVKNIREVLPISRDIKGADEQGFIIEHDGSLDDLMHRLGVKYSVACETTGFTLFETAKKVNLIWIFGIADLVKEGVG